MWNELIESARECHRPVYSLVLEALKLRASVGRIGFSEYVNFGLFKEDLTFSEKKAFGGWRLQTMLEEILVDDYSRFLCLDKITMYQLMQSYNLPIPTVRAVYRSQRPQAVVTISGPKELAEYFRTTDHLPVYMKPSFGGFGRGNKLIKKLEKNRLVFGDGSSVPLEEFCDALGDGKGFGWILQDPLVPHPLIEELCGDKISGIRVHTILMPEGPRILQAIFKINVGLNDCDNFQHGASGNMLAAINIETGLVTRVVSGMGAKQQVNPLHPKTSKALVGFQIPHWDETIKLVKEAHLGFAGYLCPGWDIAICEDGPKILEVNFFGDIDLAQHANRKGFLDEGFMSFLKVRGLSHLLFHRNKPAQLSNKNNRLGSRKHHWGW